MDHFLKDLDKAIWLKKKLQIDIAERDRKLLNGEATSRLNSKLRGGIQELAVNIDELTSMIKTYQQDPPLYKLDSSDIDKRKAQVAELERELFKIDENNRQGTKVVNGILIDFKREGSFETQYTKNLSNKDLRSVQLQMIKNQSALEDALLVGTDNMIVKEKNIRDELDRHAQLLDEANKMVGHNQLKIRMKELILKSADGCMMCCIVILIALLVATFVAL